MSKRIKLTENQNSHLLSLVYNHCPLCDKPLFKKSKGKYVSLVNMAHIFPHSPTEQEKNILQGVDILGNDANSIENIIPLCSDCHKLFDHPRSLEEYNKMKKMKEDIIKNNEIRESSHKFSLEIELKQAVTALESLEIGHNKIDILSYDAKRIDQKIFEKEYILLKRKIKYLVNNFFYILTMEFKHNINISRNFNLICSEVKTFYKKCESITSDKQMIFSSINKWFETSLHISNEISEIFTSYFIEHCEVF